MLYTEAWPGKKGLGCEPALRSHPAMTLAKRNPSCQRRPRPGSNLNSGVVDSCSRQWCVCEIVELQEHHPTREPPQFRRHDDEAELARRKIIVSSRAQRTMRWRQERTLAPTVPSGTTSVPGKKTGSERLAENSSAAALHAPHPCGAPFGLLSRTHRQSCRCVSRQREKGIASVVRTKQCDHFASTTPVTFPDTVPLDTIQHTTTRGPADRR